MRRFELVLDGITNEAILYPDGAIKCSVSGIRAGEKMLLWIKTLEELGHRSAEEYIRWMVEKAGFVEMDGGE